MLNVLLLLPAALIGYLLGSIPFGYIYVWLLKGEKLTEIGSGRTGGTNSLRAAGLGVGVLTSLSDVLKGAASVWVTTWLLGGFLGPELLPWAQATAGVASVIGHNWSLYLRFRGGAGTGPNVGWSAAIWWPTVLIAAAVMIGLLVTVGMASVASLSMAVVTVIIFTVRYFMGIDTTLAYLVGSLMALVIITWALRPNIKRIMAGEERLVGPRAKRAARKAAERETA
jgi:glycerol-3-phosphate acyltransferase PlsY